MTHHERHILALIAAAKKATDPVKMAKIEAKIREVKLNYERNKWLSQ